MKHARDQEVDWAKQDRQPGWEEQEESDGEDFILSSRRRQQQQQSHATPTVVEKGDVEPPGAPMKKKQRVIPWTREGRLRWPCGEDGNGEESGHDQVQVVADSVQGSQSGRCTDGSESSFVVDDDARSVAEEEKRSERFLARMALKEVRWSVVDRIERRRREIDRLRRQIVSLDVELRALGSDGESQTLGGETTSEDEGEEVVDERACIRARDVWRWAGTVNEDGLEDLELWKRERKAEPSVAVVS